MLAAHVSPRHRPCTGYLICRPEHTTMPSHPVMSMPRGAATARTGIHSSYCTGGSMRIVHTMGASRAFWLAVGLVLVGWVTVGQAQHLVIGLDNKIDIDEAGKQVSRPPGKDAVVIVDISNREAPRVVGTLPLMNSLLGPPTNLAVTPDDRVALVANSVSWVEEGGTWKPAPDNKLFVIDLQASPPTLVETVTVGQQPSGMA